MDKLLNFFYFFLKGKLFTSILAIVLKLFSKARSIGRLSALSFVFFSAPLSNNFLVNFRLPEIAARCSGVIPISLSYRFILAPHAIKNYPAFSDL